MAFTRSAQRIYERFALETHLENFDFDWEKRFAESELAQGRALYRGGAVRVLELHEKIAIVCLKLDDATEPYCVIDFENKKFSVRTLSHDDRTVAPYAVAGFYEIEELLADELTPLKYIPPKVEAPQEAPKTEKPRVKEPAMKLSLQFSIKKESLLFQSFWNTPKGLKSAFGKKSLDASVLNFTEREKLIRLASFARKAGFVYDGKCYRCSDASKVLQFSNSSINYWRKFFSIQKNEDLELISRGVRDVDLKASLKLEDDTLRADIYGKIGGERLSFKELKYLRGWGGRTRILPNRGIVRLAEEDDEFLVSADRSISDFGGELPPYMMFTLFGNAKKITLSEELKEWKARVFAERAVSAESSFLRGYQREGVARALSLFSGGCGMLLADEMGLGKTVQALSIISSYWDDANSFIIVCPASVIPVWRGEIEKFFPQIRANVLDASADFSRENGASVWLASYTQLRRNKQLLDGVSFKVAVLDEAQYIKNPDSKVSEACMAIRAEYRMALTGTPLENRLLDVWTIFRFLMPGLMGRRGEFEEKLSAQADFSKKIKSQITPFVLRRLKHEVARELPVKNILDLPCPLTPMQSAEYQKLVESARSLAQSAAIAQTGGRVSILSLLTRLRQAACDPALLPWIADADLSNSGKITVLHESLMSILASGRKAVVFSQFTSFIARMKKRLSADFNEANIFELTGSTKDRAEPVYKFQNCAEPAVIFVSLRAGGTGITLTAADYVFLADPWWNPAVEAQAIDRVHRIGKVDDVFVYRLIAEDTVEERVRKLQESKAALFDDIFGSLAAGGKNFEESIREILDI